MGIPVGASARIGFLIDSLLSRYQIRLFNGVKRAARERGARVIGFQGSYLRGPSDERPVFDGSFLYELVSQSSVDGLIVSSNILASGVGIDAVRALCEKRGLPAVSVGELPGFPRVEVDAQRGFRSVIEHLVRVHGKRRLAFIQGTPENPDSIERERVFRTTLEQLSIPVVPELILPGTFLEPSGQLAVRCLLDERRVPLDAIDAIVAANDQMASGATRELFARNVAVGRDIAVVGFDDDDHARGNSPPLTTVSQPVEQLGRRAVSLLLDGIAGRTVPERTLLDATPVFRRSCGCRGDDRAHPLPRSERIPLSERLSVELTGSIERLGRLDGAPLGESALRAIFAFVAGERGTPLDRLETTLIDVSQRGTDLGRVLEAIEPLGRALELEPDESARAGAERRLLEARALLSELAARLRLERELHTQQYANALRVLGSAVVGAKNARVLAQVLETGLASLGVHFACVCLFVGGGETRLSRVVALHEPAVPVPDELIQSAKQLWRAVPPSVPPQPGAVENVVFPALDLLPPDSLAPARRLDLLVYPLVFAEAALGYVVFDAPRDMHTAWIEEGLSDHLSSALYALERSDELRRARELAETASAAKSEFVAMISHEVRTPLTAVIGHVDLCLRTELTREQRGHLTRAQSSSRALLSIVNDILDFSKIEARKLALESLRFDLEDVIEQVIGTHAAAAARKGLELVVDLEDEVPRFLTGDPLRLTQVLLNLVGNAIKFSASGHVLLEVARLARVDGSGVVLEFRVADTGIGMSAEQLRVVFEPFTQADSSMTRRYGGAGLGLTISRRLVELLGGELRVESELGRGSTFCFDCVFGADAERSGAPKEGTSVRLLLIEDHPLQARALERLLVRRGYEVTHAANAREALELLEAARKAQKPFRLALVDHELPDRDGFELCRSIAADPSFTGTLTVLMSPSSAELVASGNLHEQGLWTAVPKPFHRSAVLHALAGALSLPRASMPVARPRPHADALRGRTVLVVQDSAVTRDLAKEVLESGGARVALAGDGAEAVERATRGGIDLVLMDLHLPVLDGVGATRALRADPRTRRLPILALSASARPEDRERCFAAGMTGYVSAPFGATELLEAVVRCLHVNPSGTFSAVTAASLAMPVPAIEARPATLNDELDVIQAMGRLGGDAALYRRLLRRFAGSHVDTARDVQQALARGDFDAAALLVHTLSSAAANIGATALQHAAQALEQALKRRQLELVDGLLADFELAEKSTQSAVVSALDAQPPSSTRMAEATSPAELIGRLRALLRDNDTAAIDGLAELRSLFDDHTAAAETFQRLEERVNAYDFAQARHHLDGLEHWLAARAAHGTER